MNSFCSANSYNVLNILFSILIWKLCNYNIYIENVNYYQQKQSFLTNRDISISQQKNFHAFVKGC